MNDPKSPPPLPTLPHANLAVPAPAALPGQGPGLSPEQMQQIAAARQGAAKLRRAVGVATFDAWATAIFAGLTLLGGLFGGVVAIVLGIGMAAVALVSFRSLARLRRLDPAAARTLGWNQVFLGSLLLAYAAYSLWMLNRDPLSGALAELQSAPELAGMLGDAESLARSLGLLMYGTLAAVAIFGQGGAALYYFSRRKHIERYTRETPQWIVDAQRAGLPM